MLLFSGDGFSSGATALRFALGGFIIDSDMEPWRSEGIRAALYSAPGTGKSYTVAACFVEPFLDQGGVTVIFEPRSEWHTLKETYGSVLVAGGPFQDVPLAVNSARVYAEAVIKHGVSIVFDFSEIEDRDLVRFAAELLARLYTLQNIHRRPILLFFEEMAEFCPLHSRGRAVEPWIYDRMKSRIVKIATQGRPLGFNLVFTSQRPAQLDFTTRMMANLSLYGRFHPRDLAELREVLKSYDAAVRAEECVKMPRGSWLLIASGEARIITIDAERKTPHGADTPLLSAAAPMPKEAKAAVDNLTKTIMEALEREKRERSELEEAKAKIRMLEAELEEARREIERLKTALMVKESIKVEVKPIEVKVPGVKVEDAAKHLPKIVESLDPDARQVWLLLKQRPGIYKADVMAAFRWGWRRSSKAVKTLLNRRLLKIQAKKMYALDPLV